MLLIDTYLDKSPIEGIGVFTKMRLPKGTITWRFNPHLDRILYEHDTYSIAEHLFLQKYAYYDLQLKHWILCVDNDRFTNHSDTPNTGPNEKGEVVTLRDIEVGEELTIDYWEIDDYAGKKFIKWAYES
jgi:SET domain-containing protein